MSEMIERVARVIFDARYPDGSFAADAILGGPLTWGEMTAGIAGGRIVPFVRDACLAEARAAVAEMANGSPGHAGSLAETLERAAAHYHARLEILEGLAAFGLKSMGALGVSTLEEGFRELKIVSGRPWRDAPWSDCPDPARIGPI